MIDGVGLTKMEEQVKFFTFYKDGNPELRYRMTALELQVKFRSWILEYAKTETGRDFLIIYSQGLKTIYLVLSFIVDPAGLQSSHNRDEEAELVSLLAEVKQKMFAEVFLNALHD
jgi:hypothetical protein